MREWYDDPRIRQFWMVQVGTGTKPFNSEDEAVGYAKSVASEQATPLIYRCILDSIIKTTTQLVTISPDSAPADQT